jgi:hypothetical protein
MILAIISPHRFYPRCSDILAAARAASLGPRNALAGFLITFRRFRIPVLSLDVWTKHQSVF